jgi:hypothetical protein
MSGGGEQISDAVAHQAATDNADFLFIAHVRIGEQRSGLRGGSDVISRP